MRRVLLLGLLVVGAACASSHAPAATPAPRTTGASPPVSVTSRTVDPTSSRPFLVVVPESYTGKTPVPLVVVLHGHAWSGAVEEAYLRLRPIAQQLGFLYVFPDGTKNSQGYRFWNATDACCAPTGATVDDSAYLLAVIDKIQSAYNVDTKRIYLIGFSNGGFMAYRMACDHADKIAAIVSQGGATFANAGRCTPSQPVSVLEIHGTADTTVKYNGGQIDGSPYPSAATTVATWARYDHCDSASQPTTKQLDLTTNLPGNDASVSAFPGCPRAAVELWTIANGPHVLGLSSSFDSDIVDFLYAHPKP